MKKNGPALWMMREESTASGAGGAHLGARKEVILRKDERCYPYP